jgi:hypothetical protein
MAKQITELVATTELEAVNAMLASIGEAPIASLDSATAADVQTAISLLRNTTREVQARGWRFNTEFGFQIAPFLTWNYVDSENVTTQLSSYRPPSGMIAFEMTRSPDQQGSKYTDAVVRPARSSYTGQAERTITKSPDFPGTRFGAEFQSTVAQGVSVPLTVTFDLPVQSVTVTCFDPTFPTNSMAAYDENDNLLGSINFVSNGVPGVNVPSTKTLAFASIKKIILTPGANDYVAYSMTYVAEATIAIDGNVFYDRARNRDGWPTSERQYLYIDPVWLFDFDDLPETARNYIIVRASRRLAQRALGSAELASFNDRDELLALRDLKRDQGEQDSYNIFNQAEMERGIGGRMPGVAGVSDLRASPGPKVN